MADEPHLSIPLVTIVVDDYDEALAFYVGALGFELVEDSPVGPAPAGPIRMKPAPVSILSMPFEQPPPDLVKLIAAWEEFEKGEQSPGKVLANLKTAGLPQVLAQLAESGWTPAP